jgi:hypothetical protein
MEESEKKAFQEGYKKGAIDGMRQMCRILSQSILLTSNTEKHLQEILDNMLEQQLKIIQEALQAKKQAESDKKASFGELSNNPGIQ